MYEVEAPFPHRHELGEGPFWDAGTRRLTYVDINAGTICELDPTSGDLATIELRPPISFAVPVVGSAMRICGNGDDLIAVEATGGEVGRLTVEVGKPDNRLNEGKADPAGRLWFGSMSTSHEPGEAAFYRVDECGLTRVTDGITIGNGTDWDLDRARMYHVDSTSQRVDVYDYEVDTGSATDRRPWVTIDADDGMPDGLTVDADGGVWVCLFHGGVVQRYEPSGSLTTTIELPATCPTSVAFGGDDLTTLFITTSRHRLDADQRARQPLAGAILAVETDVKGRPGAPVDPAVAALLSPVTMR